MKHIVIIDVIGIDAFNEKFNEMVIEYYTPYNLLTYVDIKGNTHYVQRFDKI